MGLLPCSPVFLKICALTSGRTSVCIGTPKLDTVLQVGSQQGRGSMLTDSLSRPVETGFLDNKMQIVIPEA